MEELTKEQVLEYSRQSLISIVDYVVDRLADDPDFLGTLPVTVPEWRWKELMESNFVRIAKILADLIENEL